MRNSCFIFLAVLITATPLSAQPPYPIIFVHGINASHYEWEDVWTHLQNNYDWHGDTLHITLDYNINYVSRLDSKENDVHLFSVASNKDFYLINFDIDHTGSRIGGNGNNFLDLQDNVNSTETTFEADLATTFGTTYTDLSDIDEVVVVGDVIRIESEYMRVTGVNVQPSGEQVTLTVQRGILGSDPEFHSVLRKIFVVSNQSNQASIEKQAWGIREAVSAVKTVTGKDKVILVGHSMGGLAARCFAQHYGQNDVAKVVTIGTPNLGAIKEDFYWDNVLSFIVAIDIKSEGVRDLAYWYNQSNLNAPDEPGVIDNSDIGVFLFGGNETDVPVGDYFNRDVNANGSEDDFIEGLNRETFPTGYETYFMIARSSLASIGHDKDGVVLLDRQWLNFDDSIYSPGDIPWSKSETLSAWHTCAQAGFFGFPNAWETGELAEIIAALDEPDSENLAYEISPNGISQGFITMQASGNPADLDYFLISPGEYSHQIISVSGEQAGLMSLRLYDEAMNELANDLGTPYEIAIDLIPGNYVVYVLGDASAGDTWEHPYTITTTATPIEFSANFSAAPTSGEAPLTVSFSDESIGNITHWEWDCDDDGYIDSFDENPQFTYTAPGTYTVTHTVTDGVFSDTEVKFDYIQIDAEPQLPDSVDDLTIRVNENDVTLWWNHVPGAQSYDVYSGPSSGFQPDVNSFLSTVADTTFFHYNILDNWDQRFYLVKANAQPFSGDLLLYLPFNGDATDASAYGRNGTVSGATLVADRHGNPASAYAFDNTNDYIEVPGAGLSIVGPFTLCAWIRPNSPAEDVRSGPIIWKLAVTGNHRDNYFLAYGTNAENNYLSPVCWTSIERASDDRDFFLASSVHPPEEWYHVAGRYNGSELSIFVDGQLENNQTIGSVVPYTGNAPLRIGNLQHASGHAHAGVFDGVIDEVRIYNRALTDQEILGIYQY